MMSLLHFFLLAELLKSSQKLKLALSRTVTAILPARTAGALVYVGGHAVHMMSSCPGVKDKLGWAGSEGNPPHSVNCVKLLCSVQPTTTSKPQLILSSLLPSRCHPGEDRHLENPFCCDSQPHALYCRPCAHAPHETVSARIVATSECSANNVVPVSDVWCSPQKPKKKKKGSPDTPPQ